MTALSSADKMKLRLSAARVERWNREKMLPPRKGATIGTNTVLAMGREKPVDIVGPDLMDSVYRASDGGKFSSMSGKLGRHSNAIVARMHSQSHYVDGVEVSQVIYCPEDGIDPIGSVLGASEKAVKAGAVKAYVPVGKIEPVKANTSSPFKRNRSTPLVVVKGKL